MTAPGELVIRPITDDEYPAFCATQNLAFGNAPDEEGAAEERKLLELDRTLAAFDGDELVACAAAFSFEMTVPGRSLPTAGVSWVGVSPTHRRRGILTSLMRRQLDDVHAAGEPLAALWASEHAIYGRFGYGSASTAYEITVPRTRNALRPVPGSDAFTVRIVDGTDALPRTIPVYDHARAQRPGMMALAGDWTAIRLYYPERLRRGGTPLYTAIAEDPSGAVCGYARFAVRPGDDFGAATTVVRELHANDGAAYAALLRLVLDLDLTTQATFFLRPPDDPLFSLVVDVRSMRPRWFDGLQVRLVDVAAALSGRTYAGPVDVVLEITDAFCPWNTDRWRLTADPTGASCERTSAAADLSIDVRELGAAYLGGVSLAATADAGLLVEHTAGSAAALSLAMQHEPRPWTPFIF